MQFLFYCLSTNYVVKAHSKLCKKLELTQDDLKKDVGKLQNIHLEKAPISSLLSESYYEKTEKNSS